MSYDQDDLVLEAAQRLGVAPDGGPAEPESAEKIRRALPAIVNDLHAQGVFAFNDLDDIPEKAFLYLADVVAWKTSGAVGTGADPAQLAAVAQSAEMKLRRLSALPFSGVTARPLFF